MRNVTRTLTIRLARKEARDLAKAWGLLSLAFAILFSTSLDLTFLLNLGISALTVGLGFVAHELAHKMVAIRYGCEAEFKANNTMLYAAVLMSFLGLIIAAPGAVRIRGALSKKQHGRIAAAGPAANLAIALLFLPLYLVGSKVGLYGAGINSLLAAFNLLPVPGFDGRQVLKWNKTGYGLLLATAVLLAFFTLYL